VDLRLLTALRCPACHSDLHPAAHHNSGALHCGACHRHYPMREGVLDLLGPPRPASIAQLVNELPPTAWAYERTWRPHALTLLSGAPLTYERELALLADWVAPERGGLLVDLACSNGLYARALARRTPPGEGLVIGIDHAMPMLREARRRALAERLEISYLRAEAQALPLQDQSAAAIAIGGSLNEIGDLERCLGEIARALAPGGRCMAMTLTTHPGRLERRMQRLLAPSGIQFWESEELIARFEECGLTLLDRQQHGIVLFTLVGRAADTR
jgi:SAM-dependent methyltransferase